MTCRKLSHHYTLFFTLAFSGVPAFGADGQLSAEMGQPMQRGIEDEISGFVMDRTITRFGHDFTRHLSDFRNMSNLGDYNLTVYERPSARWGNVIWVEHSGEKVFQIMLSPSASDIPDIAERAAKAIHQEVQKQQIRYLFSDNYDLAEDEL